MNGVSRRIREPFCGLSHAFGAVLGLIGIIVLLALSGGSALKIAAFTIYGFALIGLFSASGVYHSAIAEENHLNFLRKFDHAGIYLLISGTYVPICLIALKGQLGIALLIAQGICVAIGIGGTFLLKKFPSLLNLVLYIVMGWMAVLALGQISHEWPSYAARWLVAGGVIYTVGAVIYALDKPHLIPGRFSAHDLWHIFVLGGAFCHYMLMLSYVVRLP